MLELGPEYNTEKLNLIKAARQNQLQRLQTSMLRVSQDWNTNYGLSLEQCSWMFNHARTANLNSFPDHEATALRLGDGDIAKGDKILKQILYEGEKESSTKIYNYQNDDLIANLWSDESDWTPAFKQILKDPKMVDFVKETHKRIDKYEVTQSIGLSVFNFPQKPADIFDVPPVPYSGLNKKDLTPEQLKEREDAKLYARKSPYNL